MIYKDSMEIRGRCWEFIGINENPNQIKDSREFLEYPKIIKWNW